MKVINIFAGPGSGKSTFAVTLFSELKKRQQKVEYVSEFAKDLTYEKSYQTLDDYLYIFAQQHHMLMRLNNQVDYAICDGSFLLGYVFYKASSIYDEKLFKQMLVNVFNKYENCNYFLKREDTPYQSYGRNETFNEARKIDSKILKMLKDENISFDYINNSTSTEKIITTLL